MEEDNGSATVQTVPTSQNECGLHPRPICTPIPSLIPSLRKEQRI